MGLAYKAGQTGSFFSKSKAIALLEATGILCIE
jgi:hypothetical protein